MDVEREEKLCMFCGKDASFGEMNREHFVPKCLWVEGTRPNRIVTLPAHKSCNAAFSDDDEYFRDMLVADTFAANHPEAKRIIEGPLKRKAEHAGRFRKAFKGAAMRRVVTKAGLDLGLQPTIEVNADRFDRVLKKVVKGIFYKITGRPVQETTEVFVFSSEIVQNGEDFRFLFPSPESGNNFGDDVFRCRSITDITYPDAMWCIMQFYGWHLFGGRTVPEEVAQMQGKANKPR